MSQLPSRSSFDLRWKRGGTVLLVAVLVLVPFKGIDATPVFPPGGEAANSLQPGPRVKSSSRKPHSSQTPSQNPPTTSSELAPYSSGVPATKNEPYGNHGEKYRAPGDYDANEMYFDQKTGTFQTVPVQKNLLYYSTDPWRGQDDYGSSTKNQGATSGAAGSSGETGATEKRTRVITKELHLN
jgi:hypothetical protein